GLRDEQPRRRGRGRPGRLAPRRRSAGAVAGHLRGAGGRGPGGAGVGLLAGAIAVVERRPGSVGAGGGPGTRPVADPGRAAVAAADRGRGAERGGPRRPARRAACPPPPAPGFWRHGPRRGGTERARLAPPAAAAARAGRGTVAGDGGHLGGTPRPRPAGGA